MLISNKSIKGEQNGVDVEELEYMADFYRNRLTDIENKLLDIENSKKDFNLTISNLRRQLNLLNAKKTRNTSEVTVKVSCNSRIITDLNVSYVVNKKGKVTSVKVARRVDKYLDAEAVRVVKLLPYTTPGKQRGKPVNVQYTIPINFTLN